jgi:hypothetical protein
MTLDELSTGSVTTEWAARVVTAHLDGIGPVLRALELEAARLANWAIHLAEHLEAGGRLLVAGNASAPSAGPMRRSPSTATRRR